MIKNKKLQCAMLTLLLGVSSVQAEVAASNDSSQAAATQDGNVVFQSKDGPKSYGPETTEIIINNDETLTTLPDNLSDLSNLEKIDLSGCLNLTGKLTVNANVLKNVNISKTKITDFETKGEPKNSETRLNFVNDNARLDTFISDISLETGGRDVVWMNGLKFKDKADFARFYAPEANISFIGSDPFLYQYGIGELNPGENDKLGARIHLRLNKDGNREIKQSALAAPKALLDKFKEMRKSNPGSEELVKMKEEMSDARQNSLKKLAKDFFETWVSSKTIQNEERGVTIESEL